MWQCLQQRRGEEVRDDDLETMAQTLLGLEIGNVGFYFCRLFLSVCIHTDKNTHTHAHTHAREHTDTHTHTHTHTFDACDINIHLRFHLPRLWFC